MLYRRSREIESRLVELLRLISTGRYSTPKLAAALGVSKPTVSRCISALRDRGHPIHAIKQSNEWAYHITTELAAAPQGQREV
ncbi:MAG: HTH domain-containing protein [Isosphaeraceae bacterium]